MEEISFRLEPVAPFSLELTAWVLRRRSDNMVDRWNGTSYHRVIIIGDEPAELTVTQRGTSKSPMLQVIVTGENLSSSAKSDATAALQRLLGTGVDLKSFYRFAQDDSLLKPLMLQFRGFKPPRFLTVYEALVNGITCQQLTLTFGIQVLNRLATAFGRKLQTSQGPAFAFPQPPALAAAQPEALRKLSYSRQKSRALLELSRGMVDGSVELERLETMTDNEALRYLDDMRGVGRWTSEYVLLRGLGRLHVFPADDVGVRRSLERWLKLQKTLDYKGTRDVVTEWAPYAGLVYFHLLLSGLVRGGYIK